MGTNSGLDTPEDTAKPSHNQVDNSVERDMTPFNYNDDLGTNLWMRKLGFTWKLNENPNMWNDGNWTLGGEVITQRQARFWYTLKAKRRLTQRLLRAWRHR